MYQDNSTRNEYTTNDLDTFHNEYNTTNDNLHLNQI